MMTGCSATACSSSSSPAGHRCLRPVGPSGSTARPTTPGSDGSSATGPRSCVRASDALRRCRTSCRGWSRSGCCRLRSPTPASARDGWPRSFGARSGAASSLPCVGLAHPLPPRALAPARALLARGGLRRPLAGWRLERVLTDNGGEFRSRDFGSTLERLGTSHSRIHAGRPQTNGNVEAFHRTILDDCWRPAFVRFLHLRYTGLKRELGTYLHYYG